MEQKKKNKSILTLLSVPAAPQRTVGQLAEGQRHDGGALEVSTSNNTAVSPSASLALHLQHTSPL